MTKAKGQTAETPFRAYKSKKKNGNYWTVKSTRITGCVGRGETLPEALQDYAEKEERKTSKRRGNRYRG